MPTDPEIARYQKRSSSLNTPRGTSNKIFCVSGSKVATPAPPVMFEPLLTPAEAGVLLRDHAKTAIKMARAKVIQAIRIGKHWRFRASWINAYTPTSYNHRASPPERYGDNMPIARTRRSYQEGSIDRVPRAKGPDVWVDR
jgi:excisionase family DNA binding protein